MNKLPLVSICCITYNHEPYIREAIEGFLLQKTSFPIEIIIYDDASTDRTAEIVKEYADKHLELIIPIFQSENQYSQGVKPSRTYVIPRARGKYIAICEGDDYWTDPLKLQKQVDFLEANPDYGLVHTNCITEVNGITMPIEAGSNIVSGNVFEELLKNNFISTLTVCARKEQLIQWSDTFEKIRVEQNWKMTDYPKWLEGSLHTKFKYLNDITGFYRVLPESASHSRDRKKQYDFFMSVFDIKFYFMNRENLKDEIKEEVMIKYYNHLLNFSRYNIPDCLVGLKYLKKRKQLNLRKVLRFIKNIFPKYIAFK